MSDLFNTGHVAQLDQIQAARLKRGLPGIGSEVQALIRRLQSGGADAAASKDPRIAQAKRLWDKGFGTEMGFDSFEDYLSFIPETPEFPASYTERFPLLVLVDARLPLTKSCELAALLYSGGDQTLVDFDPKKAKTKKVYWMRAQDGRKNRGKSVEVCRKSFAEDELGLTAMEGVALYIQNPGVIEGYHLDLPGSVYAGGRDYSACLGDRDGKPKLCWLGYGCGYPYYGSASRGE